MNKYIALTFIALFVLPLKVLACTASIKADAARTSDGVSFGSVSNSSFGIGLSMSFDANPSLPGMQFHMPGASKYTFKYSKEIKSVKLSVAGKEYHTGPLVKEIDLPIGEVVVAILEWEDGVLQVSVSGNCNYSS